MVGELLEKLARALDAHNIPYMVIGGQAVLLYGEPRLTQDIDITLGVTPDERFADVMAAVREAGCTPLSNDPAAFAAATMVLPCASDAGIRADIIFSFRPYEQHAIARACPIQVGQTGVRYVRVEDLVVHKIFAGRPRDLEDVRLILLRNPDIDMSYVREWLTRFEVDLNEPFLERLSRVLP